MASQGEERLLQGQEKPNRLQTMLEGQVSSNTRPRSGLVDSKAIGRPEKLGGTLAEASNLSSGANGLTDWSCGSHHSFGHMFDLAVDKISGCDGYEP